MAGTFAEFITWPEREEIVLVELTPALVLSGWTATGGGAPNCYQVSCPALVGTGQVAGGVYRRVVGLRENGTALTERASLAACNSNAGSWFWDEAAGILYTRTSGGGDPDTYTVFSALVRFYLATTGIVLNRVDGDGSTGIYHQPWLTGDVPSIVQEVEDVLFGIKTTPSGQVMATNAHGFWHTVIAPDGQYSWKNRQVSVLLGGRYRGQELARSEYQAVATMLVDDVVADEASVTWLLKPLARLTDQQIPPTPYFEATYPNLGDGVRGTRKWIGYGRAWVAPDLTDRSGLGVWTLADAAYQTLYRVHAVHAVSSQGVRVSLTETQDYAVNLTACTVTLLNPAYPWETYRLEVDVTGKPGGARGYLSTFAEIVQDLLTVHLGVPSGDLDASAFTSAQTAAPQELALWIKEPRTIAAVISSREDGLASLERSVHGTLLQTRDGQWTCRIWEPTYDTTGATLVSLRKEDLALFRPEPKFEAVYTATRVHYAYDHARAEWDVAEDADARAQHLTGSRDVLGVYTYLCSAGDAEALAKRYQFILSHAQLAVTFEERGTRLADAEPGDRVLITHSPAPTATGVFLSRLCEITRLERRFAPMFRVSGVVEDLDALDNLPRQVGEWTDGAAPAWASASAAQRLSQGFWCDANGQPDTGDPASANASRWW